MGSESSQSLNPLPEVSAVAAAGDAIITVDEQATITSWNHAAETLFGRSANEVLGQGLALIIPEQHRPAHIAGFHQALSSDHLVHLGRPARVEGIIADGSVVPLVMSLGLLQRDGESTAVGVVAILRRADKEPDSFI
jgi:PAS domain S-box-containing protein